MSSEELKCPWCGEEMRFDADSVHCWYKCDHCLAASPKVERVWDTTKHAIANWDENLKRATACLKRVPRWISVEEGLPDEVKYVLVAAPYDDNVLQQVAFLFKGGWYVYGAGEIAPTVTHWMPLPEPPDNEKEE